MIDSGSVIAEGSPDELKRKTGEQYLEISLAVPAQLPAALAALARVCAGSLAVNDRGDGMTLQIEDAMTSVADAAAALRAANIEVADLALRRPTLDDVFLSLVGANAPEGVGA